MRWFVTGSEGQLGTALRAKLEARSQEVHGADLELDIADRASVARHLEGLPGGPPDVLLNAAAFTHVDRCEREPELAARVNAEAPGGLAALCADRGMRFVHVSTDYVFDGVADRPYAEETAPAPTSVYGRTKLEGERAAFAACPETLLVRTSWVFGRGRNFIAAILEQAEKAERGEGALRVVDDQLGRPTWAVDLAEALCHLAERGEQGVYHVANDGEATWWELARAALDLRGYEGLPIERIRTADLELDAPRPAYSVLALEKARAAGVPLPNWREALAAYLKSADAPAQPAS